MEVYSFSHSAAKNIFDNIQKSDIIKEVKAGGAARLRESNLNPLNLM